MNTNKGNDNIAKALGIFIDAMRPLLISIIEKYYPTEPWEGVFFGSLTPEKQETWNAAGKQGIEPKLRIDYNNISFLATKFRNELAKEIGNDISKTYTFDSCLRELEKARNKCQHFVPLSDDEKDRAYSNMVTIANIAEMSDLRDEINRIKVMESQPKLSMKDETQTEIKSNAIGDGNTDYLPSWFNNCLPHYDIRNGVLDESVFAANLNEVAMGTGPEVYVNPITFFEKTFMTAGMHDIVNRVVTALNGDVTSNRVISLQTGFGGGKTHTLIAIYHIVKNGIKLLNTDVAENIFGDNTKPNFNNAKVAVFTDNTNDVVQGRQINDTITTHTLWGEIAYQLGGIEGYNSIRDNDIQGIPPTSELLKPIIEKAGTSLILIDELANYCSKAAAKKIGDANLYIQTNSFIQTLTEVVSAVPKCLMIATLPASNTEIANSPIGQQILDSLQERIVRIACPIKPVDGEEVFEVVRHRLFERIYDQEVVGMVANKYKEMYHNRRNDLPDYCDKTEYAEKIRKSYPFHPELIEMFRMRWGSDSHFQRTRGVLRLLASIVQDLWKRKESLVGSQSLIHTSDVCLENLSSLTGQITKIMGIPWETVMLADVYGKSSNARKIDDSEPEGSLGRYKLTQGIATTVLMASVGAKQNKGLDINTIKLCVIRPKSFVHNDVNGALTKLKEVAHYLYSSNIGMTTYWFEAKANINILLSQAKNDVKQDEIDAEIIERLKSSSQFITDLSVNINPTGDFPEQKRLTMVILHPQYSMPTGGKVTNSLRDKVSNIALKRGNVDRIYRNTIFFLTCSEAGRATLYNDIKDFISCDKTLKERSGSLEKDQVAEINTRKHEAEKKVDTSLIKAYNVVLKYSAKNGIESYEVKNYATDFSSQVKINLMEEIKEEEWIVKSVGRSLLERINMLPDQTRNIKVKDLYEAFLRFDDKPMITGAEAIIETVNKYCTNGLFNVASGKPEKWTKIYHNESVPFLDVTSDDYWMVDTSVMPQSQTTSQTQTNTNGGSTTPTPSNQTTDAGNTGCDSPAKVRRYKKVTISGSVPLENYSQLFSSFVNTLRNNGLKIEVKFTAKSTTTNELTDNSATIKSVKESASQLGLDFEVEE